MDDEFRREKRRRRLFFVVGIALAIGVALVSYKLLEAAQASGVAAPITRSVIVAVRDIPERTVIAASDLTKRDVPEDPGLASALTNPELVVGRISGVEILAQQPITPNLLASTAAGGAFSILGPTATVAPDSPPWRAVSINVPDDRAVAGQVQVGAHVDIFVTVQVNVPPALASARPSTRSGSGSAAPSPSSAPAGPGSSPSASSAAPTPAPVPPAAFGNYYTDKSTKLTYQDVLVLAKNGPLYVLRVDEPTAEEINHLLAAGNASFSFALRPAQDTRQLDTTHYGETTNRIIERYGLPIPQAYPTPAPTP